ncbi:MAG: hypothetical protein E6Q06_05150 [Candidatus Moraniibacteriota bacterium]|nr:MAG: hypothetical protein E6Q06_05150 [Candidatus Moranbacteria bacterium]
MSSQRQVIALITLCLVSLVSYFCFSSVMDAALLNGASIFFSPIVWFLPLITLFSVGAIVWRERPYQVAGSILFVLPSLFFAPTLVHVAILSLAAILVFSGLVRIGHELASRIHFSLRRVVFVGMSQVILALSLVISSQYYAHVESFSWDRLVPSFDLAEGTGAWVLRIAGKFSPSLASLRDRDLSVDEFLAELRPAIGVASSTEAVSNGVGEAFRQAEMLRSKVELSRLLGREVGGGESMNEILSEVLRKKIIAFVSGNSAGTGEHQVPFLPFFLSILLFFTIYPIGSLLAPIALSLAAILFAFLVRMGLIAIKRVATEQDVII